MTQTSKRMKRAVLMALLDLKPGLHYTAGDVTHHAAKHSTAAARWLKPKQTSRILMEISADGAPVQMHPRGTEDDMAKKTTQRTFTLMGASV